ncbi:MAG: hypothetical protein JWO06_2481 [Bacteroidota bacterium]|nr:hypothetical protein [Bacteroidota bacterium]
MKKVLTILFILCILVGKSQFYDAQWVLAPNPSRVDFRNDTIANSSIHGFFNTILTDANICDSVGNLLFATNGVNVYDQLGDTLSNGVGLSPCLYTDLNSQDGLSIPQAALFLPMPDDNYYLIHFSADSDNRPSNLYYSLINHPNGYWEVVKKNIVFCKSRFRGGGMTACKHANGRDYWIIIGGLDDNSYYKFLLTPDTIKGPIIQNIGPSCTGPYDVAYSRFSIDGTSYATGTYVGLVTIMNFDRCAGEFSNVVTVYNNASNDPVHNPLSGSASLEFSPNGRFLYVANRTTLTQYDLWAPNTQDSVELYKADSLDHAQLSFLQMAPNGKIYGSTWNGGYYFMHVINQPNEKGDSSGFVRGGYVTLTQDDISLPNLINYKLGPLTGSGCDTLNSSILQNSISDGIRIQPNPADKYVYVEMEMQGDYELQLLNESGQLLTKRETGQIEIFDTEKLAGGIYFIKTIYKKSQIEIVTKKLVVAH